MQNPYMGQVELFPYDGMPAGYAACEGQLVPVGTNPGLFSLLGAKFGGDGKSNFALPNFTNRAPIGLQYCISMKGLPPDSTEGQFYIGEIAFFAFDALPANWILCDGRQLAVPDYVPLYGAIGNRFGGDGNVFNLPDYRSHRTEGLNYSIATTGKPPQ